MSVSTLKGEYVKSDTHKPTGTVFFILVGGGLYRGKQDHNIIGSLFTLCESSFLPAFQSCPPGPGLVMERTPNGSHPASETLS